MKTIKSIIKITILVNICLILSVSCMAQNLLSQLKDGETVKGTSQWYKSKKEGKLIILENTQNKFSNVKQSSPNLPINLTPSKFDIIFDKAQLTKICSQYIDIQQLETMLIGNKYSGINIDIRTDLTGKILEVGFYTEQNSLLKLQQIEQIENEIKKRNLVTIKPEMLRYLEGSNFWLIYPKIYYDDLLKVKQEMERSTRPIRNERN